MTDDYRPRDHDHLVEPMFHGLGVQGDPGDPLRERAREPSTGLRGLLCRLWHRLLGLVRK